MTGPSDGEAVRVKASSTSPPRLGQANTTSASGTTQFLMSTDFLNSLNSVKKQILTPEIRRKRENLSVRRMGEGLFIVLANEGMSSFTACPHPPPA